MLDGYPVNLGDVVHVLGIGAGTVTKVTNDGGFTVKTGNGEANYRAGGLIGNQRRVYWADPLIIIPPKNRRFWRAFVTLAEMLYQQCSVFYKLGDSHASDSVVE